MDALKILGGLLGDKGLSSGIGRQILQSVLGGGQMGGGQRGRMGGLPLPGLPLPGSGQSSSRSSGMGGGLLGGLLQMALQKAMASAAPPQSGPSRPQAAPPSVGRGTQEPMPQAKPCELPPQLTVDQANTQAAVLVRAMINAAKSDGRVDPQEQEAIISRLGDVTAEEAQFVRQEIARPLNLPQFIASIPPGLEQEVYAVSVMAIELDTDREAKYLDDLAHQLSLSPQMINEIHDQLGAPRLYP